MLAYFSLMLISERFDRPLHFKTTNFEFADEVSNSLATKQNVWVQFARDNAHQSVPWVVMESLEGT